jgi:hypothetical protein
MNGVSDGRREPMVPGTMIQVPAGTASAGENRDALSLTIKED